MLTRLVLDPYPAGQRLVRVYPLVYGPDTFNPGSAARFALVGVRGAAYSATTARAALLETLLARTYPGVGGAHNVVPASLADYGLAEIETTRAVLELAITQPSRRRFANVDDERALDQLTINKTYGPSHAAAGAWLALDPRLAAVRWHSRRDRDAEVVLFYGADGDAVPFRVLSMLALDEPEGQTLVNDALAAIGCTPLPPAALPEDAAPSPEDALDDDDEARSA